MATYQTAETAVLNGGKTARRADWDNCKTIRKYKDSDADFFASEFNTANAIVQDCKKSCDCQIGIWVKTEEDLTADDWLILNL